MGQRLLVCSDNIQDAKVPKIGSSTNNKQVQPADAIVNN